MTTRHTPRLSDTAAIAKRDVGDCYSGLYGSERRFRKDRALEAAFAEAIADNHPLAQPIRPLGRLVGDESLQGVCKELDK